MVLFATLLLLVVVVVAQAGAPVIQQQEFTLQGLRQGISLAGEWRFRPGDDPAWAAPDYDDSGWAGMQVPGRWPAAGFPASGQMAWYRLEVQLDAAAREELDLLHQLGVRLGKVLSAYEIYAGGQLLGGAGRLPPVGEVDYDRKRVYQLPHSAFGEDGRLLLALRVWGGERASMEAWSGGPIAGEFSLGSFPDLLFGGIVGELPGLIFSVLFIAFGIYHMYLFARNRQMNAYLWFGLIALSIGVYGLMLTQWKYLLGFSFLALKKIEFGLIYLFPALALQGIWTLLDRPIGPWLRAYQVGFVVAALLVVVIPGHTVHYLTLHAFQVCVLPALFLTPWVVFREARAGNGEARTLFIGLLVFVGACINDLLIDFAHLQTERMLAFGFIAIMLAMAVSLANRFTTMFNSLEDEVARQTAQLSEANRQLAQAAQVDHLTGLLNRRGFSEEAKMEISREYRSGRSFTLVLADVDNFKQFNDRHGHACGDHVLRRVAHILQQSIRDVDRVARWGGEEFILMLPETEDGGAAILAEKLRAAIENNLFEFGEQKLGITMTFGIASHRRGESLEGTIARADTALYHGKQGGRNKVMIGAYKGLTLVR
jgi:diguanylate cyclase (GGDEF)-like protein